MTEITKTDPRHKTSISMDCGDRLRRYSRLHTSVVTIIVVIWFVN